MRFALFLVGIFLLHFRTYAQRVRPSFYENRLQIEHFMGSSEPLRPLETSLPLFSYVLNDRYATTERVSFTNSGKQLLFSLENKLSVSFTPLDSVASYYQATLVFTNTSADTLRLRNVVPLGESQNHVYLTGFGNHSLSRAHLFRPNFSPVNVILPDNAWESGFSAVAVNPLSQGVCALMRRIKWDKATRRRFETILPPNSSVTYHFWLETYSGDWQEGLRQQFQKRQLYDLASFDNALFERTDLQWIKQSYVVHLFMAWDKRFLKAQSSTKRWSLTGYEYLYGGDDIVGIWPTWPTLGIDQRNQFDLFKDLPGGLPRLKKTGQELRTQGTKLFICYNPWDESTRDTNNPKSHLKGLSELISATGADGVVLDTRGSSSRELQEAADQVRKGVVMYSEGMAIPKDMPGIVAGRVHNALYYPPMLNLNKFIKPEFAIFRVAEQFKERIRREFATSFFNGYGTELNVFQAGTPDWVEEDYRFLGQTTRILRENSSVFLSNKFTPLIPTTHDGIFVNQWQDSTKTIYTIFSLIPEGFSGPLFEVYPRKGYHFVDLWNHRELTPILQGGKWYIEVETEPFHKKYLGTNNEGAVGCIAEIREVFRLTDDLWCAGELPPNYKVTIWKGSPSYSTTPVVTDYRCALSELEQLQFYEGKIVVQVFDKNKYGLIEESILERQAGKVRLEPIKIKFLSPTSHPDSESSPKNEILIPSGRYRHITTHSDVFLPYPEKDTTLQEMSEFLMDKNLVSNADFRRFLAATKYRPKDVTNFLKHWKNGKIQKGEETKPVVYISLEDARAYAQWTGKRLPSEREWQYAAEQDSISQPTTRLQNLQGVVWQLTNDEYQVGNYRYIMLKGGSAFKPTSSWWYAQGGSQPLTHQQILLRVSEGFERNATVGFRCVRD